MNLLSGIFWAPDSRLPTPGSRLPAPGSRPACRTGRLPTLFSFRFFSKYSSRSFFHCFFSCLNCSLMAALLFFLENLSKFPDFFFMCGDCCFTTVENKGKQYIQACREVGWMKKRSTAMENRISRSILITIHH